MSYVLFIFFIFVRIVSLFRTHMDNINSNQILNDASSSWLLNKLNICPYTLSVCPIDPRTTLTTVQLTFMCFWWRILTHWCPQVTVLDWRGISMFGREKTFWGLPWGTFLQRGDGRGGFLLLCFSPHHVHTRDQQKKEQSRHWAATRAHNTCS